MKPILNFLIFLCSIIKILSNELRILAEDDYKVAMLEINVSDPKIKINDTQFEIDMNNPIIIVDNNICANVTEKKEEKLTLNGKDYNVYSCSLPLVLFNDSKPINLSKLKIYDPNGQNLSKKKFGLGRYNAKYENNSYLSIFLNISGFINGNKIFFKSSTNQTNKNDTYKMIIGNKIPGNEMTFSNSLKNDTWSMKLSSFHFGINPADIGDNIKYKEKVVDAENKSFILNEALSFDSPSIFPNKYLEEAISKLNSNYKETSCKAEDYNGGKYINCGDKNVSLYLIFDKTGYHIPYSAIKHKEKKGFINIKFEQRNDFEIGLNILSALNRGYDIVNFNLAISQGEGLEPVDLNEPTIKETVITIIVITIIVVIITIIVMQLMKKDSNEAVDYNNMQQI